MFTVTYDITHADIQWLSCRLKDLSTSIKGKGELKADNFDLVTWFGGIDVMDAIFDTPVVVELMGGGFFKPSGAEDYVLRFPRLRKIHTDRHWMMGVSKDELQEAAKKAVTAGSMAESRQWHIELGIIDGGHAASGTIAPSNSLREKVQTRRCMDMTQRFGVEMKIGIDVESILAKADALRKRRNREAQGIEDKENSPPKKRRHLPSLNRQSSRSPLSNLHPPRVGNLLSTPDANDYHIKLGAARKSKWDKYFDTSGLTPVYIDENDYCDANILIDTVELHYSINSVRCVDICVEGGADLVRHVLLSAKTASRRCNAKWSVYFSRAAKPFDYQCSESHRLWTYINGEACR
jgi:hypothetical protein